jgi:hypothetical protein
MPLILGIDPGKSGGLALLVTGTDAPPGWLRSLPPLSPRKSTDGQRVFLWKMPSSIQQIWVILGYLGEHHRKLGGVRVGLEQVGGYVHRKGESEEQAGHRQPGSAMFRFGQNYGSLEMALCAAGLPFRYVLPHAWQSQLGVESKRKNESKPQFKRRLHAKAKCLYPTVMSTLKTCDALLIAEATRRLHGVAW